MKPPCQLPSAGRSKANNWTAAAFFDSFFPLSVAELLSDRNVDVYVSVQVHWDSEAAKCSSTSTLVFLQITLSKPTAVARESSRSFSVASAFRSRESCACFSLSTSMASPPGTKSRTIASCSCCTSASRATGRSCRSLSTTWALSACLARPPPCVRDTALTTGSKRIVQFAAGTSIPSSATTVAIKRFTRPAANAARRCLDWAADTANEAVAGLEVA
mmetsp:Transcript_21045/g.58791  ORF Transcript_21045/g.58791 Transcript_21045/m.58791 type:complete len:217 (+) Transcript_21045:25-675(+)